MGYINLYRAIKTIGTHDSETMRAIGTTMRFNYERCNVHTHNGYVFRAKLLE